MASTSTSEALTHHICAAFYWLDICMSIMLWHVLGGRAWESMHRLFKAQGMFFDNPKSRIPCLGTPMSCG